MLEFWLKSHLFVMKQIGKRIDETANTVSYWTGDRSLCHANISQAVNLRTGQEGVCRAPEALHFPPGAH